MEKTNHGGRRKGAGRPAGSVKKKNKVRVSYRLNPDLVAWMRKRPESQVSLIETALRKHYQIESDK